MAVVPVLARGATAQTANMLELRRQDESRLFAVSASGRIGINTAGPPSGIGIWAKGADDSDITMRLQRLTGQTSDLFQCIGDGGGVLASIDHDGDLLARNFEANQWQTYTPLWTGSGTPTFATRTGMWRRIGLETVLFTIRVKIGGDAGNGAGVVGSSLPTAPDRSVSWCFTGVASDGAATLNAVVEGGSGNAIDYIMKIKSADTGKLTGSDCTAGRTFIFTGVYREAN